MARSIFETLTVLVVDDSIHMRRLISRLLEVIGVRHILLAADGEEAWSKFLTHKPDIVITDAAMKPMDGFVLTHKLRTLDESELCAVPIIMVSAHSQLSAVERARDLGVTDFLCKPISPRLLYERLLGVLNRPRDFIPPSALASPDRRLGDEPFEGPDRRSAVAYI
ncbi:MAG: response regulator [Parvibaculum sp.]|uniref:response regulator n=1 Tax=Parvibaculum sp. TaxID=2024848 RepID=UPI003C72750C